MSHHYHVLYGLRIKPWDREGPVPELVAAAYGLAPGRALDLGCGTGAQSVFLAREGWEVTAVDAVPRALAAARRRAEAAGVAVDFRRGESRRSRRSASATSRWPSTAAASTACPTPSAPATRAGWPR
jgi:2-polyprenyl-3-methyl-5-hydroxy-6-metoxy-1,4-benzoquinol methylase